MRKHYIDSLVPAAAAGSSDASIDIPLNKMIRRLILHLSGTCTTGAGDAAAAHADGPFSLLTDIHIEGNHHGRFSGIRAKGQHTPQRFRGTLLRNRNLIHNQKAPKATNVGTAQSTGHPFSGTLIIDFEPWPKMAQKFRTWLNTFDYSSLKLWATFGAGTDLLIGGTYTKVLSAMTVDVEAVYADPATMPADLLSKNPQLITSYGRVPVTGADADKRLEIPTGGGLKSIMLYSYDNDAHDAAQVTDMELFADKSDSMDFKTTFLRVQGDMESMFGIAPATGVVLMDWDEDGDLAALPDLRSHKTVEMAMNVVAPAGTAFVEHLTDIMEMPTATARPARK